MPAQAEEPFSEAEEDPAKAADAHQNEKLFQCKLYKLLLEKYADLVNEKERRTIGEIKTLVNAEDLTIESIIADFKKPGFQIQSDYLEVAPKVLEFVQKEINYVEPEINLNYWLWPRKFFQPRLETTRTWQYSFAPFCLLWVTKRQQ